MALQLTSIHPNGPIQSADIIQFFNLFTGVMTDQPVTMGNALHVGGSQGAGSAAFTIGGVALQTGNMLEIRTLAADTQPVLSISKAGVIAIGPGGAVGTDTTISRASTGGIVLADAAVTGNVDPPGTGVKNLPTVVGNTGKWRFFKASTVLETITPATGEALWAPGETAARATNATYTAPPGESGSWYCNGTNWICY